MTGCMRLILSSLELSGEKLFDIGSKQTHNWEI